MKDGSQYQILYREALKMNTVKSTFAKVFPGLITGTRGK